MHIHMIKPAGRNKNSNIGKSRVHHLKSAGSDRGKSRSKQGVNPKPIYNWEGKTILIAEDEEFNFLYLKEIISPTKAVILRALDGEMAVGICQSWNVDLVLMDVKMPRMNGLDATRHIRTFNDGLPIIAQTAYTMVEDSEKCLGAGCTGYLTKPISSKVLLGVIDEHLKK
jgi:two-component system cell cycle response regulator DivK